MSISSSNVTAGFIDIATKDELEKYMYGGGSSTAYFVRETKKATWFTIIPMSLSRATGVPAFGAEWSAQVSRAGDYMLYTWLRLRMPQVTLLQSNQFGANGMLRWTRNFMHNLIYECSITFNDLVAARFDSYHLDFWAAFTTPASKQVGYDNMVGNVPALTNPQLVLPERDLNLPLPFFYARDSGLALPTAALPYNEMRINFVFRDWNQLLVLDNVAAPGGAQSVVPVVGAGADIAVAPQLTHVQVWANYAIVSNEERRRMGCSVRDILIEQVQTAPRQTFNPITNPQPTYDIRFSHNVKALFFAVRNITYRNVWSNYTTASPVPNHNTVVLEPISSVDPIHHVTLIYENTNRLNMMGADYFSLVNPWYHAPTIPGFTGYHEYSYALSFFDVDPTGGTNYGKLTNVSIQPTASPGAIVGANGTGPVGGGADFKQSYEFIITALNNNIIRISGGALGFPVL